MASSPILADGTIIIVADQVTDSHLVAFDAATGKLKWKTARANFVGGYSTPLLLGHEIVVAGPAGVTAYCAGFGDPRGGASQKGGEASRRAGSHRLPPLLPHQGARAPPP